MKVKCEVCYNCVFWTDEMKCPVRTFKDTNELKNTVVCILNDIKDDGKFADLKLVEITDAELNLTVDQMEALGIYLA